MAKTKKAAKKAAVKKKTLTQAEIAKLPWGAHDGAKLVNSKTKEVVASADSLQWIKDYHAGLANDPSYKNLEIVTNPNKQL
jgi:hypothetical protein